MPGPHNAPGKSSHRLNPNPHWPFWVKVPPLIPAVTAVTMIDLTGSGLDRSGDRALGSSDVAAFFDIPIINMAPPIPA